jgi:predicted Zn-dependent peptidase
LWSGEILAQHAYNDLEFPELTFTPPEVERHTLDNGMRLFLVENHELPVIKIYALVKTGGIYEPEDKIGLAGIASEVIRTGGTSTYSADEINETLEFLASEVEVDLQDELGTVELWTLKKNFDASFAIFADVLMNPIFAQEKVELAKAQALEEIRRRNDAPDGIASREFMRIVYGKMHPLARIPQPETIQAITRDDVVAFHDAYFHPNTVMLAVTGDFESADMITTLQTAFADWESQDVSFPDVPTATYALNPSVNLIQKDVEQTTLVLGHLGITSDNPDYAAITVLNLILGGGGSSNRLNQRVRNDLGLAYYVGSYFGAGVRDYGAFMIFCATRNEAVEEVIRIILDEVRNLRKQEVRPEELQAAKNQYLNSFVFKFATVDDIIRRRIFYEYFGYPPDFLETFRERVMHVTSADIRRVAQTYLQPEKTTILAVGNGESIRSALSIFGQVQDIVLDSVE